jgi:pyrimidine operon attenuation protein/uracil phosphoribosyltransferase
MSFSATVTVTADYRTIRAYIEALREYKRVFLIKTVTFSTQEDRGDKKLQANITIEAPYFGVKK